MTFWIAVRNAGALSLLLSSSAFGISAMLKGTVEDTAGKPVPGVTVIATRRADGLGATSRNALRATTAPDGSFSLGPFDAGTYLVFAAARSQSTSRLVAIGPGGATTRLVVPALAALSGRVLDENKEPDSGVPVTLLSREYSDGALQTAPVLTVHTDEAGRFQFAKVRPGMD